jgi:hypothetical protein
MKKNALSFLELRENVENGETQQQFRYLPLHPSLFHSKTDANPDLKALTVIKPHLNNKINNLLWMVLVTPWAMCLTAEAAICL